jgi:hypothetical protein
VPVNLISFDVPLCSLSLTDRRSVLCSECVLGGGPTKGLRTKSHGMWRHDFVRVAFFFMVGVFLCDYCNAIAFFEEFHRGPVNFQPHYSFVSPFQMTNVLHSLGFVTILPLIETTNGGLLIKGVC